MSVQTVNLQGNAHVQSQDKKAKVGKAVASTLVPGLGQLSDGRYKDAALYFGGVTILAGLANFVSLAPPCGKFLKHIAGTSDISKFKTAHETTFTAMHGIIKNPKVAKILDNIGNKISKPIKGKPFIALALTTAALGVYVAGIVDAYKGKVEKA